MTNPAIIIEAIKPAVMTKKFFLYEKSYFFNNHTPKEIPKIANIGIHNGKLSSIASSLHWPIGPCLRSENMIMLTRNTDATLKAASPPIENTEPRTKYH